MSLKKRIEASCVLGSYLDTLGFNNGKWEFNYTNPNIPNLHQAIVINQHIVTEFFALGGFNIDVSKWSASDDTIMMIATKKACLRGGSVMDFINCYVDILPQLEEKKRVSGISTLNSLRMLSKKRDMKAIPYSEVMGGNGAAMRTHYIGIHFKDNIEKIIEVSIYASRLTHNYPLGFLGGMVTALFTNYALNDIPPWEWTDKLIELEENKIIDKIMKKTDIYKEYMEDKHIFWDTWYKYKERRIKMLEYKTSEFTMPDRYLELDEILYNNKPDYNRYGATGSTCTILALDSLLSSITMKGGGYELDFKKPEDLEVNWNSVVFFSALSFADNDTIGAIAGMWYGAYCGYKDTNPNIINMLEFKKQILQ